MRAFAKLSLALFALIVAAPAVAQVQLQQAAQDKHDGPQPMPVHS